MRHHCGALGDITPGTAIIVSAWNEARVISATADRLMGMDYPVGALRVDVGDDASTDGTPEVCAGTEEAARAAARFAPAVVDLCAYGPLSCAITFSAHVQEARGAGMKWNGTEKTGKVYG